MKKHCLTTMAIMEQPTLRERNKHDVRAAIHGNRILYLENGKILDELNLPPYGNDDLSGYTQQPESMLH